MSETDPTFEIDSPDTVEGAEDLPEDVRDGDASDEEKTE